MAHREAYDFPGGPNMVTQNAFPGGNPITQFLGAPNNPADRVHLATDSLQYRNFQEWRAYDKQSVPYLRNIITMQIFSEKSFYTSEKYGLPIKQMNEVIYRISEIQIDNVVIPDEPEEGVAPVLRTRLFERQVQAKRKGIMIVMEHGFAHKPQGKRHFQQQVTVVANSILLTIFLDVIYNLMLCKPRQHRWERENAQMMMDPASIARKQASEAFILQKSKEAALGFIHRKNKIFRMRNNRSPNALYIPTGSEPYFHGAMNDRDLDTDVSGPGAYRRRMSDPTTQPGMFGGLKVCIVNIADPRTSGGFDLDPLVADRVFGSYNAMEDPYTYNYNLFVGEKTNALNERTHKIKSKTAWRDCYINDFDTDRLTKITLTKAIEECVLFKPRQFNAGDEEDLTVKGSLVNDGIGLFGFKYREPLAGGLDALNPRKFGDIPAKYFDPNVLSILRDTSETDNAVYANSWNPFENIPAVGGNIVFGQLGAPEMVQEMEDFHESNQKTLSGEDLNNYNKMYDHALGHKSLDAVKFASYVNTNSKNPATLKINVSEPLADIASLEPTHKRVLKTMKSMAEEPNVTEAAVFNPTFHNVEDVLNTHEDFHIGVEGGIAVVPKDALATDGDIGLDHLKDTLTNNGMLQVTRNVVAKAFSTATDMEDMASKIGSSATMSQIKEINNHFKNLGTGLFIASKNQNSKYKRTSTQTLREYINDGVNGFVSAFCEKEICRQELLFRAKHNLYIPFNFLLLRPWQSMQSGSAITLLGGMDTGFVGIGNKDAKCGFGVTSKIWKFHYTFNEQAVITTPLNVLNMDDMFMTRYLEGRGKEFYDHELLDQFAAGGYKLHPGRADIICHMVSQTWEPVDVFDIRGKFTMDGNSKLDNDNETCYENAKILSHVLQLNDYRDAPLGNVNSKFLNTTVHKDMTILYNPVARKFNYYVLNCGHLGKNIYEGMREDMENGKVILEQNYRSGEN